MTDTLAITQITFLPFPLPTVCTERLLSCLCSFLAHLPLCCQPPFPVKLLFSSAYKAGLGWGQCSEGLWASSMSRSLSQPACLNSCPWCSMYFSLIFHFFQLPCMSTQGQCTTAQLSTSRVSWPGHTFYTGRQLLLHCCGRVDTSC